MSVIDRWVMAAGSSHLKGEALQMFGDRKAAQYERKMFRRNDAEATLITAREIVSCLSRELAR